MKSTVWTMLGLMTLLAAPASAGDLTQVAQARSRARVYQHNQTDLELRRRAVTPRLSTRRPARVQGYNPKEVGVDRSVPWQ